MHVTVPFLNTFPKEYFIIIIFSNYLIKTSTNTNNDSKYNSPLIIHVNKLENANTN